MRTARKTPYNPVPYLGKLTLSAGVITDATRLAGVEGDGAAYPDSSVGVWPAATNLITNGGFETTLAIDATSWSGEGTGATVARTTDYAKYGSYSLEVNTPGSVTQEGAQVPGTGGSGAVVSPLTTYTMSAWVLAPLSADMVFRLKERQADGTFVTQSSSNFVGTGDWQRVTLTVTTNASTARIDPSIHNGVAPAARTFYIDGVQVEAGSIATPYIETDGGTASRVLGRWQSPPNPRLNGNQGWIAVRFKCGGLANYAPLVVLQNDTDSASDNRVHIDSNASNGRYRMERKDGAGVTVGAGLVLGDAFAAGDDGLVVARWSPTAVGFAKGGGGAWANTAATNVFDYNNHHLDTRKRWSTTTGSYTSQYWVAAGDGVMPDEGRALMHSWSNNDPLPHMFPRSWGLCELERFNGDGTMYRYSA